MKKLLVVLLVLVLGCAGAWADGEKVTATGRGQGINGDVVVKDVCGTGVDVVVTKNCEIA